MKANEIDALVAEAVRDADLTPSDIPSIDLYLDQITSLVGDRHRQGAAHFAARELTRTMINNYSKDGLLTPIKGKKYSREQILQMLLVYEMKNTLSIGEIKRVLQSVYALPDYSPEMLERVYWRYLSLKELDREQTRASVEKILCADGRRESEEDFLALILGLSTLSSYLKDAAQMLLAAHYPDTADAREREEESRRQKAGQKAEQKAEKRAAKEKKKGQTEGGADTDE